VVPFWSPPTVAVVAVDTASATTVQSVVPFDDASMT
jgi:hypothetical protein